MDLTTFPEKSAIFAGLQHPDPVRVRMRDTTSGGIHPPRPETCTDGLLPEDEMPDISLLTIAEAEGFPLLKCDTMNGIRTERLDEGLVSTDRSVAMNAAHSRYFSVFLLCDKDSRMSQLALVSHAELHEEPRILSFQKFASTRNDTPRTITQRARLQLKNRCCPICDRVTVESIELNNGILGRNGRMVPGTGTLVGFSCNACGYEWPV